MLADELGGLELLAGLTAGQREDLAARAEVVPFDRDEVLFREGHHADDWWVLLEGVIGLSRRVGREEVVVARMDAPGRWAGGFRAWDPEGVYLATGRALTPGRTVRLGAPDLRTLIDSWFPLGGHLINGVYHTARSVESTARQRGSLVALGTLAAGFAHELNNPAAAASRAVDGLAEACDALLGSLTRLARDEITSTQFAALDDLRREIGDEQAPTDRLALSDREDRVAAWLSAHGVARGRRLAAVLAAAGVDVPWCERAADALPGDALGPGLDWVAATLSAATHLERTRESTRRISGLVASIRSYSQLDRASRQRVDLREGLESTLTMLGHRVHEGVTVARAYDEPPVLDGYVGELNQVWTNLLTNAFDAVDAVAGPGTVTVRARRDGEHAVVEVADTGPGMPEEVAARAFEPFFTTKEVGRGTGLGLDIARRIVTERHGGTIEVQSSAAGTTVSVRLPVQAPD